MPQGCVVELEGKKRGKYWTFSIVDPSGLNLVRMSSENHAESEKWIKVWTGGFLSKSAGTNNFC